MIYIYFFSLSSFNQYEDEPEWLINGTNGSPIVVDDFPLDDSDYEDDFLSTDGINLDMSLSISDMCKIVYKNTIIPPDNDDCINDDEYQDDADDEEEDDTDDEIVYNETEIIDDCEKMSIEKNKKTHDRIMESLVVPINCMDCGDSSAEASAAETSTIADQRNEILQIIKLNARELQILPNIMKKYRNCIRSREYAKYIINFMKTSIELIDNSLIRHKTAYRQHKLKLEIASGTISPLGLMYNQIKKCNICFEILRGKHFYLYDGCMHSHCAKCVMNIICRSKNNECAECKTPWKLALSIRRWSSNYRIHTMNFVKQNYVTCE